MPYQQALPNSSIVEGVPDDATRAEIRDLTIERGIATKEEWNEWAPELTPFTDKAVNWMKENAEVPMGILGAVGSSLLATPTGPIGMTAAGIAGGSFFSAGGSLLSDHLTGQELDFAEAGNEAAVSLGFDILTLGAGKFIKPFAKYMKMKMTKGLSPQQAADSFIKEAGLTGDVAEAGSEESIAASQKILSEGGATLTPFQTGHATGGQIFGEKLANMGMLSSMTMGGNANKVSEVVNSSFEQIMNNSGKMGGLAEEELGATVHGIILAGKKALSDSFGEGEERILVSLAGRQAPLVHVKNAFENFIKQHADEVKSTMSPDARKLVDEFLGDIVKFGGPTTSSKSVITLAKTFRERLRAISDPQSPQFNDSAAQQLGDLSSLVNDAVMRTLDSVDKPAAAAYKQLNKEYAQGLKTLLPIINKNMMITGNKETFSAIGEMLVKEGGVESTQAFFKSIDEAFKLIGGQTLHFASANEVKATVRNAYLKKIMKELGTESFDTNTYKGLAKKFLDSSKNNKLALIMGSDYKSVKQLMNTMVEASVKPKSNIGELALRGREMTAGVAVGQLVVGLGAIGGVASGGAVAESLATGALIFVVPSFLAAASTSLKNVNKIIAFQKRDFKGNSKAMYLAATNVVEDVMRDATEEQRAQIMSDFNVQMFGTDK